MFEKELYKNHIKALGFVMVVITVSGCVGIPTKITDLLKPQQQSGVQSTSVSQRERSPRPSASPAPQQNSTPDNGSRRYALDVSRLTSANEGGEVKSIVLDFAFSNNPTPLNVLREVGYRRILTEVPLPGVGGSPPFLKCTYILPRGGRRGAEPLIRDIKFWYGKRPAIQSASAYPDLVDLKIADVSLTQCPSNWGDALTVAMGNEVWAQVKTRPDPTTVSKPSDRKNAEAASSTPPKVASAMTIASTTPSGRPLSAVEKCDNSAAHPDDPEAFGQGVPDDQLNASFAISACEEAVKLDKDAPRLAFQLARAYLVSERQEDAIEQLLTAANRGHGASFAYLADFHIEGGAGIEPDPNTARALYGRAVESGFLPAKKVLAEFEDYSEQVATAEKEEKSGTVSVSGKPALPVVPRGTEYRVPLVMNNIMNGDLNSVGYTEAWSKYYLVEVASTIGYFCRSEFKQDDIEDLRRRAALSNIDASSGGGLVIILNAAEDMILKMGNPKAALEIERQEELAGEKVVLDRSEEAAHDGIVFLSRHGCSGEQMQTFKRNSLSFINGDGAPRFNADRVLQNCVANSPNGNRRLMMEFCACVTRKITTARVTRGERVSLMSSFMPAAQSIADKQLDHFQSCS